MVGAHGYWNEFPSNNMNGFRKSSMALKKTTIHTSFLKHIQLWQRGQLTESRLLAFFACSFDAAVDDSEEQLLVICRSLGGDSV